MNIKARYAEFKAKHDLDNADVAALSIYGTIVVGFIGSVIYAGVKASSEAEKIDEWSNTQYEAGRHVYELANGSLIATEKIYVY